MKLKANKVGRDEFVAKRREIMKMAEEVDESFSESHCPSQVHESLSLLPPTNSAKIMWCTKASWWYSTRTG